MPEPCSCCSNYLADSRDIHRERMLGVKAAVNPIAGRMRLGFKALTQSVRWGHSLTPSARGCPPDTLIAVRHDRRGLSADT